VETVCTINRIRGTTVDSVANVLQHPILATCRPQDSFSAAAGVSDSIPSKDAPAALLESRARGGGRLFERSPAHRYREQRLEPPQAADLQ